MAKPTRRRLLLFVAGVGAGNTTRTLAWLDELRAQYARELNLLADKADDAFVETEGW